jgi:predicted NBD/HSP70 family sugar kinase
VALRLDAIGQRSETVRRANLGAIARELHTRGPLSRSDLVAATGLTRSAIRGLIGEFVVAGLASEERAESLGTPGRPSPVVRLNPTGATVLALEIAVDSIAVGIVGLGGEVLELIRVDRPRDRISVDDVVADLTELAATVRDRIPASDNLIGVGVAIVGIVRRSDGFLSMAPNLGWTDVPLGHLLARSLDLGVPIALGNEADLGALGELRRGAAIGSDNVLFISGEVGVGGGLIVDGRPLTGAAGYGGEVGHFPVNRNGLACRCGSAGCWETEVGEGALLRLAGHPPDGGRSEVEAVLREAADGSAIALAALDAVGRWLGYGLAGLVNVLNSQLVVLGGVFCRIHPVVARPLAEEFDRRTLPASRALVRIVPAMLGVDASLRGAAELAFDPFLADPAAWLRPRTAVAELATA